MKIEENKINLIKDKLIQSLKDNFNEEIKKIEIQFEHIKQASIEAPGAMQSHHDVSKDEYSKLASVLQDQLTKLKEDLNVLEKYNIEDLSHNKIIVGSLIKTIHNSETKMYFLLPVGNAQTVESKDLDNKVIIINTVSPIGNLLLNKKVGDSFKIGSGELSITEIY